MEFKRGQEVLVREPSSMLWWKRIYLAHVEGCEEPHIVVVGKDTDKFKRGGKFQCISYAEAKEVDGHIGLIGKSDD